MCQTMPLPDAVSDPGLCHLRPPGRARNGACPEHRRRDPEIGRFLTRDPLPGIVGSPASQNSYAYVMNNPVRYADPSGLFLKELGDAATSVGGTIASGAEAVYKAGDDALNVAVDAGCSQPQAAFACGFVGIGPLGDSYFDLNFTLGCFGVGTFGIQYKASQGFYGYSGTGTDTCQYLSASFTMGYNQDIGPGWACGVQAAHNFPTPWGIPTGPAAQAGVYGLQDKEGGFDPVAPPGGTFGEAGIGIGFIGGGASATCMKISPLPYLTW